MISGTNMHSLDAAGARVAVDDGRITAVEPTDDAREGALLPGFVDLQCNGWEGVDLAEAKSDGFARVGRALLAHGTTAWCPTLPSVSRDIYPRFLDTAAEARDRPGPRLLGVHLEGPFLDPRRAGAHPAEHLRAPDADWLARMLDHVPGLVRIVTLSPELPGALECIEACVERGVTVGLGHTSASADDAARAFDAGATLVPHLFNAMRPLHHRDIGIVGAALTDDRVRCALIADGRHVHLGLVAFVARGLGPLRCVLTSDAVARPTNDPLRGGFVLLDQAVANVSANGVDLVDAVRMATTTPADAIGATDVGRLEPGAFADAVLWRDGKVARTWLGGEPV